MTRDARQELFIEKFVKNNGKGMLEAATAFGKTRVALKIIQRLRMRDANRFVIIVVPHEYLQKQWQKLLVEWGLDKNSAVHIINSHIKRKFKCSLLILDEVHRYAADSFSKVFECTDYKFILGLTALIKRLDKKHGIVTEYVPVIDRVSLEEARLNGWVAEYQEYNLGIDMDEATEMLYNQQEENYNYSMGIFQWDFIMLRRCAVSYKPYMSGGDYKNSACSELARTYGWTGNSPRTAYEQMLKKVKNFWGGDMNNPYHPSKLQIRAVNGLRSIRKIKEIVCGYEGKLDIATRLINEMPERKVITFSELTITADEMAKRTSESASYHSSMVVHDDSGKVLSKSKGKNHIIKLVNEDKIQRIHTARALDEGADFPEISLGIRISGSSSPTQQTQRRGRIIRKHGDKQSVMVNLYLKRTKEVQWLSKSQGYSEDISWVESVDELINDLKT